MCIITAKAAVKALTEFFSTLGLPKVIHTNQGNNLHLKFILTISSKLHLQVFKVAKYYTPYI